MADKSQKAAQSNDDTVISLSERKSLSLIVGEQKEGDSKFASVIDLGDIDHSRTKGADAAYKYLNGEPGEFRVMTTKPLSPTKVIMYSIFVFVAGVASTMFALKI